MTSAATMNYLFYLGIVLPTLITVLLFLLFLGCWRRLAARREVLTKRHDPHGRLRALGLPLLPPPPPLCVRASSLRLAEIGAGNEGFSASRSPSALTPGLAAIALGGPGLYQTIPAPDSGLGPELLDLGVAMPGVSGVQRVSGASCMAVGASGGASGGAGGAGGKERPESQASHGSSDSQDSGFRSSRSGQYLAGAAHPPTLPPSLEAPLRTPRDPPPPSTFTRSRSEHHRDWTPSRGSGLGAWSGSGRARHPPDKLPPRGSDALSPQSVSELSPHALEQFSLHSPGHLSPKRLNTFGHAGGEASGRSPRQTLDLQDINLGGQAGWRPEDTPTPKSKPRLPSCCAETALTTALVHGPEGEADLMGYSVV